MVFGFGKKNKEEVTTERSIEWNKIQSSFVEAVAYDDDNNDLYVTLDHGSYVYHGVPTNVFESFINAPSKGSFFNGKVKDAYNFTPR